MSTKPADQTKTKAQLLTELNELRQRVAYLEATADPLNHSEERYRSVVTAMAEGVVMHQRSGEIVACNPAAEQILGLSRDQMMGRTSLDPRWRAIHEDGTAFPGEMHPAIVTLRTGQPQRNVVMGVHKPDGSLTWILINAEPMVQPGAGDPYAVVATFTDITQQRQAEAALAESEQKYRQLVELTQEGIWQIDAAANTTYANPRMAEMLGYTVEEMRGRHLFSFMDEQGVKLAQRNLERRQQGITEQHDFEFIRQDGQRIYTMISTSSVMDEAGQYIGAVALVADITARKQAEVALAESEQKFRQVVEQSNDGVLLYDETGRLIEWNSAAEQIVGQKRAEVVGGLIWDNLFRILPSERQTPAVYAQLKSQWLTYFQTGQHPSLNQTLDLEIQHPDGTHRLVETSRFSIKTERGYLLSAVIRDVTEHRQIEARLRESETRFHTMFTNHAAVMLLVESTTGQIIDANLASAQFYGYSASQLCTMNIADLNMLPPDQIHSERQKALTGNGNVFVFPHRLATGEVRMVEVHSSPIPSANQALLFSIIHDVTKRQQAEAALLESQERLTLTLQGADLGTWDWHVPSGTVVFNERWAEMLGYTLAEIEPQVSEWEKLLHPEDASAVMAAVNAHLEGRTPLYQTEHRLRSKSGEWKWILDTGKVFERDEQGQPVRVVGIHQDITQRKQVEIALHKSEARFKAVFDCAGVGITLITPNGPRLQGNPALQQMLGYSAEELSEITHLNMTHPDDRALTKARMADLLGGRLDSTRLEKRYLHKNGQTVWVDLSITPIRTEQGQPVAFIGAMVDITARKKTEADLQASEAKFRQVIERSSDAIMLADETGQTIEWNLAAEQVTGVTRSAVLGRPGWEVQFDMLPVEQRTQATREQIKAGLWSYIETGLDPALNRQVELEIQRPDGSYRDIQSAAFAFEIGSSYGLGSIIRDVTERKQVERIEAAQLAVNQVLAGSPEPAAALRQLLAAIVERLGWQAANLWGLDRSGSRLVWQESWYAPDQPELAEFERFSQRCTFEPGEGLTGTVWQTGRAIWDQDLRLVKGASNVLAVGLHSASGIPIIKDGETVGVMAFFSRSVRPLEERLLTTLNDLGRQIGQFLARKETVAALRESQERLELVVDAAELGTWDSHLPSGVAVFNERWAEMLGYSLAELEPTMSAWEKLADPADLARVMEGLQTHLEGQTPHFQIEHRLRTKSGEWKWILTTGKAMVRDEQGQPVRVVGIHQDISQRKEAEEHLRRYEQMVSTSPDWLSLIDCNYVYRIVNQAYLASHNKSYDQIVGRLVAELFGEAVFTTVIKPRLDQALAGEMVQYQGWFDFPYVGRRFTSVTYAPYQEKDGAISGVLVSGRDMTEAKQLEEHLQQVQKMGAIGQLSAGMAHHYNSMLTAIIGFTSLSLRALPPGDPIVRNLERVLNTAERMAVLVRQLLAFAQKQLLQFKTVHLNELVRQLQDRLQQMVPAPIEFVLNLTPEGCQVRIDPRQFEYLLLALVSNAVDAMPQGGRLTLTTARVSLGAMEASWYNLTPGDYVLLTVKDTGTGLTDEVKAHLYEPFFTTKEVGQGTGLGLAMSLGIAKQHGGHLLAESQSGQGATFMLYLPCLAPPPPVLPPVRPTAAGTILLVEADPMVREFVAEVLSDQGYTVLKATTTEVAQQLMAGRPEVSLQLLLTPAHSNSSALIEQLKPNSPSLKVIYLVDEIEELPQTRVDFMTKPFAPSSLVQKVRAVLVTVPE